MEERPSLPTDSLCLRWGLGFWKCSVLPMEGHLLSRVGIVSEMSLGDSSGVLPWQPVSVFAWGLTSLLFDLCCLRPNEAISGLFVLIYSPFLG